MKNFETILPFCCCPLVFPRFQHLQMHARSKMPRLRRINTKLDRCRSTNEGETIKLKTRLQRNKKLCNLICAPAIGCDSNHDQIIRSCQAPEIGNRLPSFFRNPRCPFSHLWAVTKRIRWRRALPYFTGAPSHTSRALPNFTREPLTPPGRYRTLPVALSHFRGVTEIFRRWCRGQKICPITNVNSKFMLLLSILAQPKTRWMTTGSHVFQCCGLQ